MSPQTYLRAERIKRGWTQAYVGNKVGVSKVAIHDIETGKQKPSYDVLLKLLALFNVDHKNISQLFAAVEDVQPDYINSNPDGVEEIRELEAAVNDFDLDVDSVLDIARDGRLDDPHRRKIMSRLLKAMERVLGGAA